MSGKNSQRLSNQVIGLILSLYFGIAVALTLVQLFSEFKQEKDNLTHQIMGLSDTFSPTITEALWAYQNEQVAAALEGLYKNAEVYGVIISNSDGELWQVGYSIADDGEVTLHRSPDKTPKILDLTKAYHQLYAYTLELTHIEGETVENVGSMSMYYSSSTVIDRTWQTFVITIIGAILKTLCLWVISVLVINRLISKPLNQLKDDINNVDVQSVDSNILENYQPLSSKNNELLELGESFKTFCKALIESNQEVSRYRGDLEDKVEKRTESLNVALKELTESNKIKSDFLAVMSHEIRTPMSAVIGTAQVLKKTPLTEEQAKLVETITYGGKTLIALINDILNFSKMEAGKLELESIPLNVIELIGHNVDVFSSTAHDKGIELTFDHKDDPPLLVNGDPTRLSQVISNLLGNAIKFTEEGSVKVSLCDVEEINEDIKFSIVITDTGIGLTEEQQDGLFEAFSQADSSTTRKYGGTGLGLTICQRLVNAMGGQILVESDGSSGSTFSISLQLPKATEVNNQSSLDTDSVSDTEEAQSSEPSPSVRVLLVDDVPLNLQIAQALLEHSGFHVLTAGDGEEAIKQYQEHRDAIDIILMDCLMPKMDGYEATRQMRSIEQQRGLPATPIVALTANAYSQAREQCIAAGMNDFLTKPVLRDELLKTLSHYLHSLDEAMPEPLGCCAAGKRPDYSAVLGLLADELGEEALRSLLTSFTRQAHALLGKTREALQRSDTRSACQHLESLQKACSTLELESLRVEIQSLLALAESPAGISHDSLAVLESHLQELSEHAPVAP